MPHIPPEEAFYYHSTTEVYEDGSGNIKICSTTDGEDFSCSDKFWYVMPSIADHGVYLGVKVDCDGTKLGDDVSAGFLI